MNYCLIGKDRFRMLARVKAITSQLSEQFSDLQPTHLLSNVSLAELSEHIDTQSLWGGQNLVVVDGLLSSKDQNKVSFIENWLKQNNPLTTLILIEEAEPIKKNYQGFIDNPYIQIECYPLLTNIEVRQWLRQHLAINQVTLDDQAFSWLLTNFSNDLWRLSNEIKKLQFLYSGEIISLIMIKKVVVPTLSDNMFATIDALAQRNLVLANKLINTQLTTGTSEAELITLIAYQFRNIALIKVLLSQKLSQTEIAKRVELHPYVVKKSAQFMREFSLGQLQKIMDVIQKIDQAIKRGQTPPKIGLDILMAQIIKS